MVINYCCCFAERNAQKEFATFSLESCILSIFFLFFAASADGQCMDTGARLQSVSAQVIYLFYCHCLH